MNALPSDAPIGKPVLLARFRDGGVMEECLAVLQQHHIPYKLSSSAPVFEISSIGSGGVNNQAMVSVSEANLTAARTALLEDARATIQLVPPIPGDYLTTMDTPFLMKMALEPDGWSFHDLATAEWLLRERKAEIQEVLFPPADLPPADYPPVRAKWQVIVVSTLLTGGIMGAIVGWSLIFSRQHGKDSPYHYDQFSRGFGTVIFGLTILVWTVSISLIWATIINPLGGSHHPSFYYHEK
jgi:hypothetical protein